MWSTPDLPLSKSADSLQKPQDDVCFQEWTNFQCLPHSTKSLRALERKKRQPTHLSDEIGVVLVSLYGVAAYVPITPLLFLYLMTFSQVSGHL